MKDVSTIAIRNAGQAVEVPRATCKCSKAFGDAYQSWLKRRGLEPEGPRPRKYRK